MLLPFIEFILPILILLVINIVLEYKKSDFGSQLASIISLILTEFAFFIVTSKDSAKDCNFKMIEIISYAPLTSSFFCIISVLTDSSAFFDDHYAPFFIVNLIIGSIALMLIIFIIANAIIRKYFHKLGKKSYVSVSN